MPKLNDYRPEPEPPPVRPPILPPDFPDIPQNPSSELQPPSDPSAAADKVAGTTPAPDEPGEAEVAKDELRRKNVRLREKISSVLEHHPELRDTTDEIASKQGTQLEGGTPFLERIQANLQGRARAVIERRPDLEHLFDD